MVAAASAATLVTILALGGAAPARTACDAAGAEAEAVAKARAAVSDRCDCSVAERDAWTRCVRKTLKTLVADGALSPRWKRHARRLENRSACGRPGSVVCCTTTAEGETTAAIVEEGACNAPSGGSACESTWRHVADACTADGCAPPATCGNGVVERGETCDPPTTWTCDASCRRPPPGCADEASSLLIDCTLNSISVVAAAATDDRSLVAYPKRQPNKPTRIVARRFFADGKFVDKKPRVVSDRPGGAPGKVGWAPVATADASSFYVAWEASGTFGDPDTGLLFVNCFRGRRVPPAGRIASQVDSLASYEFFSSCRTAGSGPLRLAPDLVPGAFHATHRRLFVCGPDTLAENIAGLDELPWAPPFPGYISTGPAALARRATDVAAVWLGAHVSDDFPMPPSSLTPFLAWLSDAAVEELPVPGPTMLDGSFLFGLAALGDLFLVVWTDEAPDGAEHAREIRALRFTRAAGALDPAGGIVLAKMDNPVRHLVATSDGSTARGRDHRRHRMPRACREPLGDAGGVQSPRVRARGGPGNRGSGGGTSGVSVVYPARAAIMLAVRSAMIATAAFGCPRGTVGMTDASATQRPSKPCRRSAGGSHPARAGRVVDRLLRLAAGREQLLVALPRGSGSKLAGRLAGERLGAGDAPRQPHAVEEPSRIRALGVGEQGEVDRGRTHRIGAREPQRAA